MLAKTRALSLKTCDKKVDIIQKINIFEAKKIKDVLCLQVYLFCSVAQLFMRLKGSLAHFERNCEENNNGLERELGSSILDDIKDLQILPTTEFYLWS